MDELELIEKITGKILQSLSTEGKDMKSINLYDFQME